MNRAARWWLLSDLHLGVSDDDRGASDMALAWLVVLTIGAAAVGLRLIAILRRVTQETR